MINPAPFLIKLFLILLFAVCISIFAFAVVNYSGNVLIYILFSIFGNALLLNGLRSSALFFDSFIGIFLWLGFWLKFSIRMALNNANFLESLYFNRSPSAYDNALLISSIGLCSILIASLIRERVFTYPSEVQTCRTSALFGFYQKHRILSVSLFVLLVLLISVSNLWFVIYQRGMVSETVLPWGLNGVYKWLLLFGLSSIASIIIRYEIELNKNLTFLAVAPGLFENFISNVSMLSRGMVINSSALMLGTLRLISQLRIQIKPIRILIVFIAFVFLFIFSVISVNYLRAVAYEHAAHEVEARECASHKRTVQECVGYEHVNNGQEKSKNESVILLQVEKPSVNTVHDMTVPLFLERWVGIEGVVAVSASESLGWKLWSEAWQERFDESVLSIYDNKFVDTPYRDTNSKFHFVSLPGLIAFLYLPGSLPFLIFGLVISVWIASVIEIMTYYYAGKNLILCSLIGQVVAYRYSNFGYVPSQSYLLLGGIALNIIIVHSAEIILMRWKRSHSNDI